MGRTAAAIQRPLPLVRSGRGFHLPRAKPPRAGRSRDMQLARFGVPVPVPRLTPKRRPWPCFPRAQDGELLSSWLCRVAWANGLSYWALYRLLWGDRRFITQDVDRVPHSLRFCELAQRTEHRTGEIRKLGLFGEQGDALFRQSDLLTREPWHYWTLPIGGASQGASRASLTYCPDCLRADPEPFIRRNWRYTAIFACEAHARLLVAGCPHCGGRIDHRQESEKRRSLRKCPQCLGDLAETGGLDDAGRAALDERRLQSQRRVTRAFTTGSVRLGTEVEASLAEFLVMLRPVNCLIREDKWHSGRAREHARRNRERVKALGLLTEMGTPRRFRCQPPQVRAELVTLFFELVDSCSRESLAATHEHARRALRDFRWADRFLALDALAERAAHVAAMLGSVAG